MATTETTPIISIRLMQTDDIDAVTRIENQAYFAPWPRFAFFASLAQGYHAFVMEQDDEIIGYTLVTRVADEAHIINFVIAPGMQHQGLGKRLLRFLLEYLQHLKVMRITLEVASNNQAAIRLYESFGFKHKGIRKAYYQTSAGLQDALILVRESDYTSTSIIS